LEEENVRLKEHLDSLESELQAEKEHFCEEFQALREMTTKSLTNEDNTLETIRMLEEECLRMSEILSTRADHIAYFENRLN
jgi:dynactin complex subunit